jgi:pyruvate dehydrogenase E2 component (dihydrolipoamide acetyltransferase)
MARVEVPMPQMGESIAEGTVSVWLKKVGEQVARDEPIMEISTDKVDAEIPSPAAGTLVEILVQEGATVEVGTVVAYIDTEAGAAAATPPPEPPLPESAAGQPEPQAEPQPRAGAAASAGTDPTPKAAASVEAVPASHPAAPAAAADDLEQRLRLRSSPLVRRIAEEHGIDLAEVKGSGRLGRVTKEDILGYLEHRSAPGADDGRHAATPAGGVNWEEFYTHVEHPAVAAGPGDRVEPMSRMTQLVAEHMVISRRISPHVHSYFEIDYSRIDALRARYRAAWAEKGVKVTYTAFITRAVATALREHPKVNAAVSGTQVIYRSEINVGIAVALPWGLIVPVVRNADNLSLVGMAHAIADLADRARAKRLSPQEVQGGTFTITNPGVFGTVLGFPIINQPQVAILAVGAAEKRPVVVSDEFGNDAIVARRRGFISLGYDHRLVNGADGDQFLARVKEILETFPEGG